MSIDVTDLCEDKSSAHKGGVNPEIWFEGTRIGFRCPGTIVLDHPMFFVENGRYGTRIIKYLDDEYARLRGWTR